MTEKVGDEESRAHGGIEAGFGEPKAGLGFHNGRGLLAGDLAGPKVDAVTDEGVEGKDADARDRALGHLRRGEVMGGSPSDPQGGGEHEKPDGETDEVFQLADSVGKSVVGGASNGANGEEGGEDGEEIGRFLEKIAEKGEGVGEVDGTTHQGNIHQAEEEGVVKAAFASAWSGSGVHRRTGQKHGFV